MKFFLVVLFGLAADAQTPIQCVEITEEANCTSDNGCATSFPCASTGKDDFFTCLGHSTAEECNADNVCAWAGIFCTTRCSADYADDRSGCDADANCTSVLTCVDFTCKDHSTNQNCETASNCTWNGQCSVKAELTLNCFSKSTEECVADPKCGDTFGLCTPSMGILAECIVGNSDGCNAQDNCEWSEMCGDAYDSSGDGDTCQDHSTNQNCETTSSCTWKAECSAKAELALNCFSKSTEECVADPKCEDTFGFCTPSMSIVAECMVEADNSDGCNAQDNCEWSESCGDKDDSSGDGDEAKCRPNDDLVINCGFKSLELCTADPTCMSFQGTCTVAMETALECSLGGSDTPASCDALPNCQSKPNSLKPTEACAADYEEGGKHNSKMNATEACIQANGQSDCSCYVETLAVMKSECPSYYDMVKLTALVPPECINDSSSVKNANFLTLTTSCVALVILGYIM